MFSSTEKHLFCLLLSLALTACGNSKFEAPKSKGQRTFVDHKAGNESYDVELRGQDFQRPQGDSQSFQGLPPTALSRSMGSALYEDETFELQIGHEKVSFSLDLESGLKFSELDESGRYSIKGNCHNYSCSTAAFELEDLRVSEVTELLYARTYEYLTSDEGLALEKIERQLIAEAIEYKFPIARHSLRVNNSRDIDKLIIERPKVDIGYSAEVDSPTNVKSKPIPKADERIELDASGTITVKVQTNRGENGETKPNKEGSRLRLTPNPYEAYVELELPSYFYSRTEKVNAHNPLNFQNHEAFIPVAEQKELEPAQRIAAIAKAFVDQKVKIYQNACNHYVRAVMALAGYTEGGIERSNIFQKVFRRNSQGLRDWEILDYKSSSQTTKGQLQVDMSKMLDDHGLIYQAIRLSLPSKLDRNGQLAPPAGHTGILVKEGSQVVLYESSWFDFGPRRTVIEEPQTLLNSSRPEVKLHYYPGTVDKSR